MRAAAGVTAVGRRRVLGGLVSAGLLAATGVRAATLPEDRHFAVFRKGERIGRHAATFRATAGGLAVRHEIDLTVRFAIVPIYRYRQDAEDLWRDGRLVASEAETDDNGERTSVRVRERDGRLRCEGPKGVLEAALGTMTDLSYWNSAIVRQRGLIDSRLGELAPLVMAGGASETIEVDGRPVAARRWQMNPHGTEGGEVWYDEAGRIVKAVVRTRGEVLDYRLIL